jgi:nucleoid-associated protein YgaU
MGSVQQAVVEFDEKIQAPWRPRLVSGSDAGDSASVRPPFAHPSRRSASRVGACCSSAPSARPVGPARQAAGEAGVRAAAPGGAAVAESQPHRRPVQSRRPAQGRRPAPRRTPPVRLRLTSRARRLAVVLALATGVAVGSWLGSLIGAGGGDLRLAGESSVVVQPGDTLWSIASSLHDDGDVRAVVDEIQQLNGLRGTEIRPGQTLLLP